MAKAVSGWYLAHTGKPLSGAALETACRVQVLGQNGTEGEQETFGWMFESHRKRVETLAHESPEEAQALADEYVADMRRGMAKSRGPLQTPVAPGEAPEVGVQRAEAPEATLARHEWARACLLAELADEQRAVREFRADHLPGGAVFAGRQEMELWIHDRTPRRLASAPKARPGESTREWWLRFKAWEHRREPVLGWVGEDRQPRRVPTFGTGPLARLAGLAGELAEAYGWEPETAAVFVLMGGVPGCPMLSARVHFGPDRSWSRWVTLRVHADVPSPLVAEAYLAAQGRLRDGRPRLLKEAADAVAVSVTVPGGPKAWNNALRRGDRGHKGYSNVAVLAGVVRRSRPKLLGGDSSDDVASRAKAILVKADADLETD